MLYSALPQARKRVETAIDLIQKHLIVDTKKEVLKITAMLKNEVWGHLTNMQRDVAEVKLKMVAGFAEIKTEFKHVRWRNVHSDMLLACVWWCAGRVPLSEGRLGACARANPCLPPPSSHHRMLTHREARTYQCMHACTHPHAGERDVEKAGREIRQAGREIRQAGR